MGRGASFTHSPSQLPTQLYRQESYCPKTAKSFAPIMTLIGSDPTLSPSLYLSVFIVAFVAMFPKDAINFGALINATLKMHCMNLRMWLISYQMWRKLDRDMKKSFGQGMPPFKYVHLWERSDKL